MPSSPLRAHGETVQARILEAAGRRFEAFGYRGTGMAEIAREAGVAVGTLYRYFRNKEHVFFEVVRELNERWLARARDAISGRGSGAERLERLGPASVELWRERSLLNAVLARDTDIVFAPLIEEMRRDVLEQTVGLMADVIRDGIADGSMRAVDPEGTAFILFVSGNTLFSEPGADYQELLPLYADIIQHGLRPR